MSSIETAAPEAAPGRAVRPFPWPLLAVTAGVALVLAPLLVQHAQQLWLRPHYQFFPLVLVGAAFLAWQRLRPGEPFTPGSRGLTYGLVGCVWLLSAVAVVVNSSWLGTVAALVLLAAALLGVGGTRLFRRALPAWLLLWLA